MNKPTPPTETRNSGDHPGNPVVMRAKMVPQSMVDEQTRRFRRIRAQAEAAAERAYWDEVQKASGLDTGDTLRSSPESAFDPARPAPVEESRALPLVPDEWANDAIAAALKEVLRAAEELDKAGLLSLHNLRVRVSDAFPELVEQTGSE
jgi:hypothetical protein